MRRSRRWSDEEGSASLEFVGAGVLLLVPLVYLVLALSSIQAAALAAEGAARQAARVFVEAPDPASAAAAADRAVRLTMSDYGVEPGNAALRITCEPEPSTCLRRGSVVTSTVAMSVPLPLVPPGIQVSVPLSVPLRAEATQRVSRFWGAG